MTDIDAIQAAVHRAAAFQRHADENGYGRPVQPEAAVTDLEQFATRLPDVVTLIRDISGKLHHEAEIAARPGQYDRLEAMSADLRGLADFIEQGAH